MNEKKRTGGLKLSQKLSAALRLLDEAEKDKRLSKDDKGALETLRSRVHLLLKNFNSLLSEDTLFGGKYGLAVTLNVTEESRSIGFSLDNLGKEKVVKLISEGGLYEEIMTLFRLAHLPGADYYTLNISLPDIYFDLIDRVHLDLDESFHPTRKKRQAGPLDIIARHPPYDKISEVETGLLWIRNKRADEQG